MGLKAALSKPFAAFVLKGINKWKKNAVVVQHEVLSMLVKEAKDTSFGTLFQLRTIMTLKNKFQFETMKIFGLI
jgi:hypothetical protein